jgi:hypothetical protein
MSQQSDPAWQALWVIIFAITLAIFICSFKSNDSTKSEISIEQRTE